MSTLPSGTVTFVFTDIESSTRLLKQLGDADYGQLLGIHRRLVRDTFSGYDGHEIDTQGDAFFYSFVRARQAVGAAIDLQRAHARASWPGDVEVRVRLGLHTGEPAIGDEGYTGLDVVRAARIAATGDGGQVLISDTTRAITASDLPEGVTLRGLGERQLKDIDRPEPVWELAIDDVRPIPEVDPVPEASPSAPSSAMEDFVEHARQSIEARVLASLEAALPGLNPGASPDALAVPRRSSTKEIERLHRLREDGALTEDQYRRAVDRILDADAGVPPSPSEG